MNFIHEANKIYVNDDNNHMIAIVTFPKAKEGVVTVDHTYVDSSLRGQGVAGKLMQELVTNLKESNRKAVPTCSYAVKWFNEHPEFSDLLAD